MKSNLFKNSSNPILDLKTYAEFRKALEQSNCPKCHLCESRTHIVVDRGNPQSKVMIIGEAPGKDEDLKQKPFVGRSGKLLDRLFQEIGFDTNRDSLVVNIVKCRPPENRAPRPDEAQACRPYLNKQIALMRPRWILLLGATALKHMLPEKAKLSMSEVVGKTFKHPQFPEAEFIVLFHPAYLLRDPRKTPLMQGHLQTFKKMWELV